MSRFDEKMIAQSCFVCGANEFETRINDYRKCLNCGHEILVSTAKQGFIVNDNLCEKDVRKTSGLDRFKATTLTHFDNGIERNQLLDIGSASGKFLLHNFGRYAKATGLEITAESLAFSRQVLGLDVVEDIHEISNEISVATAWHSLEHIPEPHLLALLESLSRQIMKHGRLIVSVPNSDSWQYRWFGSSYAYYDVPNHLHQFTLKSLTVLLNRYGFHHIETMTSWRYNIFGYTQSLLNVLTRTHNYLYYRLKRRSQKPAWHLDVLNGVLLVFVIPASWLLAAIDTISSKRQGVITACFVRR